MAGHRLGGIEMKFVYIVWNIEDTYHPSMCGVFSSLQKAKDSKSWITFEYFSSWKWYDAIGVRLAYRINREKVR